MNLISPTDIARRLARRRAERRRPRTVEELADLRVKARKQLRSSLKLTAVFGLLVLILPATALAAEAKADIHPFITLALTLGGLSLLPFAVMTLTSFLRIVIVLSFLRSGLGAQNVPPNVVIIALALFLSLFVMGPTITEINKEALVPYNAKKIEASEAFLRAQAPLKKFMVNQLGKNSNEEVMQFYRMSLEQKTSDVPSPEEMERLTEKDPKAALMALPLRVVIPSFIISELKKAFIMGFAVLLPFLVIDMVISNILLSLGMFMLPPVVISLPFKILLFVLAGGWTMVVEFLLKGFNY